MRSVSWSMFILLCSIAVMAAPVAPAPYYADVTLDVHPDGSTAVSGTTNHPLLAAGTTQAFTSKAGDHWLLNITIPDTLSDYVFTVLLPEGATVNYVSSKNVALSSESGRVVVKLVGTQSPVSIVAQYRIGPPKRDVTEWIFEALASLATVGGFALVFWLAHRHGERRARKEAEALGKKEPQKTVQTSITLYDGLPPRQRDIVDLLKKSGGKLTQKQIGEALKLPKASVSRNVESLRRKGLLQKEQNGMSNLVQLR